ncbi:MAG: hypothetical protein H6739_42205 [Alphaproteobacteria bacterium]|nr:hypothetical protein [Alphaproteobacteria bacterium]
MTRAAERLAEGLPPAHTLILSQRRAGLLHDEGLTVLDSASFKPLLQLDGPVHAACFDGERLIVVQGNTLLEERPGGWDRRALATPDDPVVAAAAAGPWVAWTGVLHTGAYMGLTTSSLRGMDRRTGHTVSLEPYGEENPEIGSLTVTPQGALLAAGGDTVWNQWGASPCHMQMIWVWQLPGGQVLGVDEVDGDSGAFDPSARAPATMSADGRWLIQDAGGESSIKDTSGLVPGAPVSWSSLSCLDEVYVGGRVAVTPDSRLLIVADRDRIACVGLDTIRARLDALRSAPGYDGSHLWCHLPSYAALDPLAPGSGADVTAVTASPDGRAALWMDAEGTLWRVALG